MLVKGPKFATVFPNGRKKNCNKQIGRLIGSELRDANTWPHYFTMIKLAPSLTLIPRNGRNDVPANVANSKLNHGGWGGGRGGGGREPK